MQSFISSTISVGIVLALTGCASTQQTDSSTHIVESNQSSETVYAQKATMRVDGLGCPMCAESISILLKDVDGVQSSSVDLSRGLVTVDLDQSVPVAIQDLSNAITDGGFTFRSIQFSDRLQP